jgi:hypothetical protein
MHTSRSVSWERERFWCLPRLPKTVLRDMPAMICENIVLSFGFFDLMLHERNLDLLVG